MTREEAKTEIEEEFKIFLEGTALDDKKRLKKAMKENEELRKIVEANKMAIKALEIESCDDAISRQYLLDNCVMDKVTMPYVPINRIEYAPSVNPVPCEDAISRQAVLDIIDSDWKYEGMEQYIDNLPSVNPQQKTCWIPVSEGLPEMVEFYLTFIKWDDGTERVTISWFDGMSFKAEVKAWMPLPKPYEPQATDKDAETQATEFLAEARACAESEG